MNPPTTLSFQPLAPADYPLLLTWLLKPHVKEWWDDGDDTLQKVADHYGAETETERFLIFNIESVSASPVPIGYIQSYKADEHGVGIDLFLGEELVLNRGIGTQVLQAFIRQVIKKHHPAYLVVDPDPLNTRAIRCYEKVGFSHFETCTGEDSQFAYMMRF